MPYSDPEKHKEKVHLNYLSRKLLLKQAQLTKELTKTIIEQYRKIIVSRYSYPYKTISENTNLEVLGVSKCPTAFKLPIIHKSFEINNPDSIRGAVKAVALEEDDFLLNGYAKLGIEGLRANDRLFFPSNGKKLKDDILSAITLILEETKEPQNTPFNVFIYSDTLIEGGGNCMVGHCNITLFGSPAMLKNSVLVAQTQGTEREVLIAQDLTVTVKDDLKTGLLYEILAPHIFNPKTVCEITNANY